MNINKITTKYTNLELQSLLLIAELELFIRAGNTVNTDIIIALDNFRKMELLTYGSNNTNIREMVQAIRQEIGNVNNN
jgi:hypothetical protein